MKNKGLKINYGLLIAFGALILLMTIGLWLVQTVFMDEIYFGVKKSDLQRISTSVSTMLDATPVVSAKDESVINNINELCKESEASYALIVNGQPSGNGYMQDDTLFSLLINHKVDQFILDAERNLSTKVVPVTTGPNPNDATTSALLLIKGIANGENGSVVLVLCTSVFPIDSVTKTIRIQLITVTAITLVVAVIISIFVSKKLAKPITILSNESKKLAKGNYDLSFPNQSGVTEIDDLVDSLSKSAKELESTERLQKDLVANISHDLRTPLTLVQGYAELMRDIPEENNQENLQTIIDEIKHMEDLISDVLDLSKLQSGVAEFKDELFDFTALAQEEIDRYRNLTKNEYDIEFIKNADTLTVFADKSKIQSVISNLLSNAVKYTGADKKIKVMIESAQNKLRFSVHDTGAGIPQDKLKDIWQRYYKLDSSNTHQRAKTGSGLGLAIVKSVLDHYKANCGVHSNQNGSIFWFILDLAPSV